jgi:hypothetical protein
MACGRMDESVSGKEYLAGCFGKKWTETIRTEMHPLRRREVQTVRKKGPDGVRVMTDAEVRLFDSLTGG